MYKIKVKNLFISLELLVVWPYIVPHCGFVHTVKLYILKLLVVNFSTKKKKKCCVLRTSYWFNGLRILFVLLWCCFRTLRYQLGNSNPTQHQNS